MAHEDLLINYVKHRARRALWAWSVLAAIVLAVLAVMEGTWGGHTVGSLSRSYAAWVRLLIATPVFLFSTLQIVYVFDSVIKHFITTDFLPDEVAYRKGEKLRDAVLKLRSINVSLVVFVLVVVLGVSYTKYLIISDDTSTWMRKGFTGSEFSLAGWWYLCACLPVFQLTFLGCLWRWCVWVLFVVRASTLNFRCFPFHPDHAGGFSQLGRASVSFTGMAMGLSTVVSAEMLTQVLYDHRTLQSCLPLVLSMIGIILVALFGPLLTWIPKLLKAKNDALLSYGTVINQMVQTFEKRWFQDNPSKHLLDSSDASAGADFSAVYSLIEHMSPLPFRRSDVVAVVIVSGLPLLPLVLAVVPMGRILKALVQTLLA